MPDRSPRPRGTQEGVGNQDFVDRILRPDEIAGSNPMVSIVVGRAPNGIGFFLLRRQHNVGSDRAAVASVQRRWREGPESTEESLTILAQALRWYFENEGIPFP